MKVVTFTFMITIDAATFACLMKCFLDFYFAAPRIPPDKRIFTTTHSPNCVFQDVDERFVWTVNAHLNENRSPKRRLVNDEDSLECFL